MTRALPFQWHTVVTGMEYCFTIRYSRYFQSNLVLFGSGELTLSCRSRSNRPPTVKISLRRDIFSGGSCYSIAEIAEPCGRGLPTAELKFG